MMIWWNGPCVLNMLLFSRADGVLDLLNLDNFGLLAWHHLRHLGHRRLELQPQMRLPILIGSRYLHRNVNSANFSDLFEAIPTTSLRQTLTTFKGRKLYL